MHFEIPVFILLLFSSHTLHAAIDYCTEDVGCESPSKNTLCYYSGTSPCEKGEVTMNDAVRQAILNYHNDYRARFANAKINSRYPSASNMNQLSYDYELESFAQRLAIHECKVDGHDECRKTKRYNHVGQNIAWQGHSRATPNVTQPGFTGWVEELKDFSPSLVASYGSSGGVTGHFTQVIWAETHLVGCGQASYSVAMNMHTLVCNYATGGNMLGDPVYKAGPPCSNCPSGANCSDEYPGLCKIPLSEVDKPFSTIDALRLRGTLLSPGVCFLLIPSLIIVNFHEFR